MSLLASSVSHHSSWGQHDKKKPRMKIKFFIWRLPKGTKKSKTNGCKVAHAFQDHFLWSNHTPPQYLKLACKQRRQDQILVPPSKIIRFENNIQKTLTETFACCCWWQSRKFLGHRGATFLMKKPGPARQDKEVGSKGSYKKLTLKNKEALHWKVL